MPQLCARVSHEVRGPSERYLCVSHNITMTLNLKGGLHVTFV